MKLKGESEKTKQKKPPPKNAQPPYCSLSFYFTSFVVYCI